MNIIGCVEYELGGKTDATTPLTDTAEPDPPGPVGDIDVSPNAISEVGVCGDIERSIQITNNGDGDLNLIEITVSGTSWTASLPALPLLLAPLDSIEFPLTGTTGAGEVTIQSDDPDEPFIVIPLDSLFPGSSWCLARHFWMIILTRVCSEYSVQTKAVLHMRMLICR